MDMGYHTANDQSIPDASPPNPGALALCFEALLFCPQASSSQQSKSSLASRADLCWDEVAAQVPDMNDAFCRKQMPYQVLAMMHTLTNLIQFLLPRLFY
jgi:hypothetical protein